ncbi:hypothetical protein PT974_08021 [Cladobotryum mycophilum]|uniref:DUF7580 domain-containing protein n=1 Tax=Cladobotryum mycophilum TaxID=491253 RepID=A0ABR0SD38_9HYPO
MSGFEVIGVVLGAIPLIISALEHYREGAQVMHRWRNYDRERKSLIRNLMTEHVKLQNTCEGLLVGLVPPTRIEAMVKDPLGDLWKEEEIQRKIRARLSRTWSVFEENIKSMEVAIEEMKRKLGDTNKLNWSDFESIRTYFRRASFSLRRSTYTNEESIVQDLKFYLAMCDKFDPAAAQPLTEKRVGEEISIIVGPRRKPIPSPTASSISDAETNNSTKRSNKKEKPKVTFSLSLSKPHKKLVSTLVASPHLGGYMSLNTGGQDTAATSMSNPGSTEDLCMMIRKAKKRREGERYGMIIDQDSEAPRSFSVYPAEIVSRNDDCDRKMMSLLEVLENRNNMGQMRWHHRIQTAVFIASGVLQLYQTPWLPDLLSSRNIFFVQRDGLVDFNNVFVVAGDNLPQAGNNQFIANPTLMTLGVMLLEIMQGQTIGSLRTPNDTFAGTGILSDCMTAMRVLPETNWPSSGYKSAVEFCIKSNFYSTNLNLNDEGSRREITCPELHIWINTGTSSISQALVNMTPNLMALTFRPPHQTAFTYLDPDTILKGTPSSEPSEGASSSHPDNPYIKEEKMAVYWEAFGIVKKDNKNGSTPLVDTAILTLLA